MIPKGLQNTNIHVSLLGWNFTLTIAITSEIYENIYVLPGGMGGFLDIY